MRNPARKALYALLAPAVSAALIRFGIERHEAVGPGWGPDGPILLGLAALPFALVTIIQALFAVRGQAGLPAGIGAIARRQACPGEWQAARVFDRYDRLTRPGPGISHRALGWIYGACASLILGTLVASAVIHLFVPSLREGPGEFVLTGLLIGSSMLALFAAVLVVATLLLGRRT